MNDVWVFVEQRDGNIVTVSKELISKARELADQLSVQVSALLIGSNLRAEAESILPYRIDNLFLVDEPRLQHYTPVPYTKIAVDIFKKEEARIILYGATAIGRDLAPRIASKLVTGLTADCTELQIGDHTVRDTEYKNILYQIRPAFGGNIIATIVSPEHRPEMATVRPGVMKLATPDPSWNGKITTVPITLGDEYFPTKIIKRELIKKIVDLTSAQIIVAGGIGVGSKENFRLIWELAETLGGKVGASRAAVDAGYISRLHQVGQTGVTVRPKLYIACGISGSIQHRAGMDKSSRIIAINTDSNAPIFQVSHYGIVGDLRDVIPKLIKSYKTL